VVWLPWSRGMVPRNGENKMGNMSYCRFQNTSKDLDDCQNALEELAGRDAWPLSREELAAAKRLVHTCLDIVSLIAEEGGLEVEELLDDESKIDTILNILNRDNIAIDDNCTGSGP